MAGEYAGQIEEYAARTCGMVLDADAARYAGRTEVYDWRSRPRCKTLNETCALYKECYGLILSHHSSEGNPKRESSSFQVVCDCFELERAFV